MFFFELFLWLPLTFCCQLQKSCLFIFSLRPIKNIYASKPQSTEKSILSYCLLLQCLLTYKRYTCELFPNLKVYMIRKWKLRQINFQTSVYGNYNFPSFVSVLNFVFNDLICFNKLVLSCSNFCCI